MLDFIKHHPYYQKVTVAARHSRVFHYYNENQNLKNIPLMVPVGKLKSAANEMSNKPLQAIFLGKDA